MYDIQYADSKILLHCLLAAYIREVPYNADGRDKVIENIKSAHDKLISEDIGCIVALHYSCMDDSEASVKDSTIIVVKLGREEYIVLCLHEDTDVSVIGEKIAKIILEERK